jgi:hypothetical protein
MHIMASTEYDSLCVLSAHISRKLKPTALHWGLGYLPFSILRVPLPRCGFSERPPSRGGVECLTVTISTPPPPQKKKKKKGLTMQFRPPQRRVYPVVLGRVHASLVGHVYQDRVCFSVSSYATHFLGYRAYFSTIIEVPFWPIFDIVVTLIRCMAGLHMTRSCCFLVMTYYIQIGHRSIQSSL